MNARQRLRGLILGPAGPVLISAAVVVGFAWPHWWNRSYAEPPQQGASLACTVERVVDGDTVEARCPQGRLRVRIWGIDAPEMGQAHWGQASRQHLDTLLQARAVTMQVEDLDKYGRVVARLHRGSLDVGLQMVRDGHATVRSRYVLDQHYRDTRTRARKRGQGIWSQPGSQQQPWEWRKLNPPLRPAT